MNDFQGFHRDSDQTVPFPVDDHGRVPLRWFAEESYDPDKILALYNAGRLLPALSVENVLLPKDEAWRLWDEMILRHLSRPTHRFEEPSEESSSPPLDDPLVTFPGLDSADQE